MIHHECDVAVPIRDLPIMVVHLLERAPQRLLCGVHGQFALFVRYLRRKPGRGLAISYRVGPRSISRRNRARGLARWVTVTIGEPALAEFQIHSHVQSVQETALDVRWPGILTTAMGLNVHVFPYDSDLAALAASCSPTPDSPLFSALETAARIQLCDPSWRLAFAYAEPVRYKPSSRCVIRYRLLLEKAAQEGTCQKDFTLFGKLYKDPEQARTIHAAMEQLYAEQEQTGQPLIPRPLVTVETLGLMLSAAVPPPTDAEVETTKAGPCALRPRFVRDNRRRIVGMAIPGDELRLTAVWLARLHTSKVQPTGVPRTPGDEAKRVAERASIIAERNPEYADAVRRLGHLLVKRLEALQFDLFRPAHGGFKTSQLLFTERQLFVVDLDGFCLADPALDVGYFLAYLRPAGFWYHRPGMRRWFEDSAGSFVDAYRQGLYQRGIDEATAEDILQRARLYEAAILFKIATRRVHRLNSPRPGELSAILTEVDFLIN